RSRSHSRPQARWPPSLYARRRSSAIAAHIRGDVSASRPLLATGSRGRLPHILNREFPSHLVPRGAGRHAGAEDDLTSLPMSHRSIRRHAWGGGRPPAMVGRLAPTGRNRPPPLVYGEP